MRIVGLQYFSFILSTKRIEFSKFSVLYQKQYTNAHSYFLMIPLLLFLGCGDVISSKKYQQDFVFNEPFSLHVSNSPMYDSIANAFRTHGFTVDPTPLPLHVNVTTNPKEQHCSLSGSHIAKENFVRISIMKNNEEMYRIQCNQKENFSLNNIEKLIEKLIEDVKK